MSTQKLKNFLNTLNVEVKERSVREHYKYEMVRSIANHLGETDSELKDLVLEVYKKLSD